MKGNNEIKSTAHSKYRCQYHLVFAPKYRRKEVYGKIRQDIGEILRKLCNQKGVEIIEAEAVGRNKKVIAEYIRNQLEEDFVAEQMSIKEYIDPFTGDMRKSAKTKVGRTLVAWERVEESLSGIILKSICIRKRHQKNPSFVFHL